MRQILYAHQVFYNDNERQQWSELHQTLQNSDRNVRQDNLCFGRKARNTISNMDKILMMRTSSLLQIDAPKPVRTFEILIVRRALI